MIPLRDLLISLRPKHWIKNAFIFMPLIFGQKMFYFPENMRVAGGFLAFGLLASGIYLLNDLADAGKDRHHRTKRLRPIAAGRLDRKVVLLTAFSLLTGAFLCGALVHPASLPVLVVYAVLNVVYTRFLKEIVILDVFSIAAFFLLRVVYGTFLAGVIFSHWMLFAVALLAMFMGFNKRRQELVLTREAVEHRGVLRKYTPYFIDQMISVLTASIVVVYMLYTIDERTVSQFGTRDLIYTIPFVYYGLFRYLYLVHRWRHGEDPTQIILSDRMMQINCVLWLAASVFIIYFQK